MVTKEIRFLSAAVMGGFMPISRDKQSLLYRLEDLEMKVTIISNYSLVDLHLAVVFRKIYVNLRTANKKLDLGLNLGDLSRYTNEHWSANIRRNPTADEEVPTHIQHTIKTAVNGARDLLSLKDSRFKTVEEMVVAMKLHLQGLEPIVYAIWQDLPRYRNAVMGLQP